MLLLRLLVKLLVLVAVLVLAVGVRENHDRLTGCVGAGAGVAAGALVVW